MMLDDELLAQPRHDGDCDTYFAASEESTNHAMLTRDNAEDVDSDYGDCGDDESGTSDGDQQTEFSPRKNDKQSDCVCTLWTRVRMAWGLVVRLKFNPIR